jgi:cytochrome c oxidase subunit 4
MAEATVGRNTYYKVTAALMVLLGLTVAVYFVPLGTFGVVAALTIAFSKAVLIILYFMHVRYSSRLTMVMAGAGFFWLVILFALTFSDYLTRTGMIGG